MKNTTKTTLFNVLHKWYVTIPLCILFAMTPYMPAYLQRSFGVESDLAAMWTWIMFATSTVSLYVHLKIWDTWLSPRHGFGWPFYLQAAVLGSLLATVSGFAALIGIYGISALLYLAIRDNMAHFIIALMFMLVILQLSWFPFYNKIIKGSDWEKRILKEHQ